jgi:hypothetical protein
MTTIQFVPSPTYVVGKEEILTYILNTTNIFVIKKVLEQNTINRKDFGSK